MAFKQYSIAPWFFPSISVFLLIACYPCIQLKKRQTIDQSKGFFLDQSSLYKGGVRVKSQDSVLTSVYNVVLFENGHILVSPESDDTFGKSVLSEKEWVLYDNGAPYQWGKYYLFGDSIRIEFVQNISSGGGCKIRSVRYSGHYEENQITILPGPENENNVGLSQYILPKDGLSLIFVEEISDSLIDPYKAKLLK